MQRYVSMFYAAAVFVLGIALFGTGTLPLSGAAGRLHTLRVLLSGAFEWFGELALFTGRLIRAAVTAPYEIEELMRQCDSLGAMSFPLVALAGAATGVVIALQTRDALS